MVSKKNVRKDKYISVVGSSYIEEIVIPKMAEIFPIYQSNSAKKNFQASVFEHTNTSAAILLTVIALESFANKIYYHEFHKAPESVISDIVDIISNGLSDFPSDYLKDLLGELFLIRDTVAHNFIFEITVSRNESWNYIEHQQELIGGFGRKKNFESLIDKIQWKTKVLGINVQPLKMSFEDLFLVLTIYDITISLFQKKFGFGKAPFQLLEELEKDVWAKKLSEVLAYYWEKIDDRIFKNNYNKLIKKLETFKPFIAEEEDWGGQKIWVYNVDSVLDNICPRCKNFGYRKPELKWSCEECEPDIKSTDNENRI